MSQSEKVLQGMYASVDASLLRKLRLVFKLSVMCLGFSCALFIYGMIGLFVVNLSTYTIGMLVAGHCVWVSCMVFITSILGISGYQNGGFNRFPAKLHAVFVVLSELALMAGLALSIKAIVDMPVLVNNFRATHLSLSAPVLAALHATAYGGSIVIIFLYTFFFGCCLFSGYTYYIASKNPQLNMDNILVESPSLPPESTPISEKNYIYEEAEVVGQF